VDLRKLMTVPKYSSTKSAEDIAREQAFYAGQLWAIQKLEALEFRWKDGAK
jgi:hypothetical protein